MHIDPRKTGMALGALIGSLHIVWSLLVALNAGQWLLDFAFELHMIHPVYTVGPFELMTAFWLVVVTACIAYLVGYAFALCSNYVHRA